MSQFAFGSGVLYGVRTDVANSTPIQFGILQDASIDFAFTTKMLTGQYTFPVAVGRGTSKIQCKAKFGKFNALIFNDLFFGQSGSTGLLSTAASEAGTIPSTPYQITVVNAATFSVDYGVINAVTLLPLKKVASAPATGQYSVNIATGVYTFAAADTTNTVQISYTYAPVSGGTVLTITNPLLGVAPTFQANLMVQYNAKQVNVQLNACMSSKLTLATKLEDFTIPEFDFDAFADASNNIGKMSVVE